MTKMTDQPTFEVLNIGDICNILGCSPATVSRYIAEEKLPPPFKLGKSRLWVREELIAHLKAAAKEQRQ